ncbi:DNA topoisomerase 2, partial [Tanacetum coccineum]
EGLDYDPKNEICIRFLRFFNTEYKEFGRANIQRSIPSMVDGFTKVRRKVLCAAFKCLTETIISLEDFGGHVSTLMVYHHANTSLESTIKLMSHSNNINLIKANGEIDIKSRYGEIELHPIARYLFHKDDELLLNYSNEDDLGNEPACLIPIIPMLLVNGADATAVGCRTYIPNYNPREIITNLKHLINGKATQAMLPWYKAHNDEMNKERRHGLSTTNMYVLDAEGKLKKYDTPEKLLEDFYRLRLDFYKQRKTSLVHELNIASMQLKSKERFAQTPKEENVAVKGYDGYDYLISQLADLYEPEYIDKLEEDKKATDTKLQHLNVATPESLWLEDLVALDAQLDLCIDAAHDWKASSDSTHRNRAPFKRRSQLWRDVKRHGAIEKALPSVVEINTGDHGLGIECSVETQCDNAIITNAIKNLAVHRLSNIPGKQTSDSSLFNNTSRPRSLGKEVMLDFEHSAVRLTSTEHDLNSVLMESRSFRDDLYGSLFQQSGSVSNRRPLTTQPLNTDGDAEQLCFLTRTVHTTVIRAIGISQHGVFG